MHQTVIVVIAYYVVQFGAGAAVKFTTIAITSLLGSVLICELVKQSNVARFLFGMKRKKRAALAVPSPYGDRLTDRPS